MENIFLAAPSEQYQAGFLALVEDYKTNGEKNILNPTAKHATIFPLMCKS